RGNVSTLRHPRRRTAGDTHRRAPGLQRQDRPESHRRRRGDPLPGQVPAPGLTRPTPGPAPARHHQRGPRPPPAHATTSPPPPPHPRARRPRAPPSVLRGCHQPTPLDAHPTTPWSHGGPTDIDGLALLCRRHHVMVHEGGLHLAPTPERTSTYQPRYQVLDTTGHPVQARWPAMLEHLTLYKTPTGKTADQAESQQAAGHHGPDPTRIAPTTGGTGFNLANCVDTLLHNILQLTA